MPASVCSQGGPSEILIHRRGSSPLVAAENNAAAPHFAEQDDVHNGSVFHPAMRTVIERVRAPAEAPALPPFLGRA